MSGLRNKAGFATLGATITCLAIAIAVSGLVSYAASANQASRANLERVQAQARLDNGQLLAALGVFENVKAGRLRWTEARGGETFDILAEPEFDKVKVPDVDAGRMTLFAHLGARDPEAVTQYLQAGYAAGGLPSIAQADASPLWRNCAASALSFYGRASTPTLTAAAEPDRKGGRPRSGEVWRIVVSSGGFVDERLVRMTDSGRTPALLIDRNFRRGTAGDEPCANLIGAL